MEQNQMSKFCIDLEGVMLPDAIATVVEAWYDAQSVGNLIEREHVSYQPGDPIEVRDSASPGSAWKRGWVFYKACNAKVGICLADKWDYELSKPHYIASGGGHYCGTGDVFTNPTVSGCRLKQPQNIRKIVIQPWEKQQAQVAG
jgi:hypothetical protein